MCQYVPEQVSTWDYFRFTENIETHFIPADDNTYELVIVVSYGARLPFSSNSLPFKANEYFSPRVFNTTVNGVNAYATADLVVEHPQKKGYWKILGRVDSQIIHSSGEKTNPGPLGMSFLYSQSMGSNIYSFPYREHHEPGFSCSRLCHVWTWQIPSWNPYRTHEGRTV